MKDIGLTSTGTLIQHNNILKMRKWYWYVVKYVVICHNPAQTEPKLSHLGEVILKQGKSTKFYKNIQDRMSQIAVPFAN